jgi:hypothetical protein
MKKKPEFKYKLAHIKTIFSKIKDLYDNITSPNIVNPLLNYTILTKKFKLDAFKKYSKILDLTINNYILFKLVTSYYKLFKHDLNILLPCNVRSEHSETMENKLAFPTLHFRDVHTYIPTFLEYIDNHKEKLKNQEYHVLHYISEHIRNIDTDFFTKIRNQTKNITIMLTNIAGYKKQTSIEKCNVVNIYHKAPVLNSIPINISVSSYNNELNFVIECHYKYKNFCNLFFRTIQDF